MRLRYSFLFLLLPMLAFAEKRPNILWLTMEDTSPQYIGCYGNASAITPNIDSLAATGVRFSNAYSTATVCSPSRNCIITGMRSAATGNGHHRSAYPLPASIKGFPSYLKEDGYYTTNNYKTDYNTSDANRLISESWSVSSGSAHWRNRVGDQPFFSVFNYADCHQSRTMTEPYSWYLENVFNKMPASYVVSKDEVYMPPYYRDSREMRKHVARMQNSINYTDKQIGDRLSELEADGLMDETIIFIYADHGEGMPRAKGNGIAQGYKVPMIIYFPDQYQYLNPWNTAVVDELVSFEDLAPTILSLAEVSSPTYYRGRAFLGKARNTSDPYAYGARDRLDDALDFSRSIMKDSFIYVRNFMPDRQEFEMAKYYDIGEISNAIRNDYWDNKLDEAQGLMMQPQRSVECLYNLKTDPWELNNLAADETYSEIKLELSAQLKNEMREIRDVHLIPEYQLSQLVSPYTDRQDESILPIDTVLNVAWLSGEKSAAIRTQIEAINSSINLVRYWAIVGLRMQDSSVLQNYQPNIEAAMGDLYLPVQVEAAYIAYKYFNNTDAKAKLENFAKGNDACLANAAVQNIINLNDGGLAFVTTLEKVALSGQYHAKILAQTYLHYYDKRELYWGNGTAQVWDAYSTYPFSTNSKDLFGNHNLSGDSVLIVNDEIRGNVLKNVKQGGLMTFDSHFFLPKNYSVSFWMKPEVSSEGEICVFSDNDDSLLVRLTLNDEGALMLSVNNVNATSSELITTDDWHHVVLSHWGDDYKLFLNGYCEATLVNDNSSDITEGVFANQLLGYFDDLNVYHYPYTDARAYSVYLNEMQLSDNELRREPLHWYRFENNLNDEMGKFNLTSEDKGAYENDKNRGNVLRMDGTATSAIVEKEMPSLPSDFSITFMLKASTLDKWMAPIAFGDANDFIYLCPYTSWENGMYLVVDNEEERVFHVVSNKTFIANEWFHIAMTYTRGNWKYYVDGVETGYFYQLINGSDLDRMVISGVPHKVGSYFKGAMDNLRIYNYSLAPDEVITDKRISENTISNIGERELKEVFTVFPNPARKYVTINSTRCITEACIYDMLGNLIMKKNSVGQTVILPLKAIGSGLYILTVMCEGEQISTILRLL